MPQINADDSHPDVERQRYLLPNPTKPFSPVWHGAIHERLAQQVNLYPDNPAVIDEHGRLSYKEVHAYSNQLANYLLANNVRPQDRVAIYSQRGAALVWSILGIIKAGAIFLILDTSYPSTRLIQQLSQVNIRAILQLDHFTDNHAPLVDFIRKLPLCCHLQYMPGDIISKGPLGNYSTEVPSVEVAPDDLAYIAFTSGSTGGPKGILGTHRPLSHFLEWYAQTFSLNTQDHFALLSGLAHDPLLRDIFTPLWVGTCLHIPAQNMWNSSNKIVDWLQQERVTVLHLTPVMAQWLSRAATVNEMSRKDFSPLSSLRYAFFGGDTLTKRDVREIQELAPKITCVNFYGATETPQAMSYFVVPPDEDGKSNLAERIPLGRGINSVQILILNEQRQLADIGETGEIYIHTPYLARGYLNDNLLTQQRFITNPFTGVAEDRLYRTGDLGRYRNDGNVEFLGRLDRQIKLRGFRIELEEIEMALHQHPCIQKSFVILHNSLQDSPQLVAYFVSFPESPVSEKDLRHFLKEKLPYYMLPTMFIPIGSFPRTPNGKIDIDALPLPRNNYQNESEEPLTSTEKILLDICKRVLAIAQVHKHDDFFSLGCHSLLIFQIASHIRDAFNVDLPIRLLFEEPTVAQLATYVDQASSFFGNSFDLTLEKTTLPGSELPLTFPQQQLWFLDKLIPSNGAYNIPILLHLHGQLDKTALLRSINEIVRRHEALRTTFDIREGEPVQVIAPFLSLSLTERDLQSLSESEQDEQKNFWLSTYIQQPFELDRGPLLRIVLMKVDKQEYFLAFIMHHIIFDGWSVHIFLRELGVLYEAFVKNMPSPLPELSFRYADFILWQRARQQAMEPQLAYWKKQLKSIPLEIALPLDYSRPALQTFQGSRLSFRLSEELSDALKQFSRCEGITLFMTLLAAFQIMLARYSGQEDIVVGTPVTNRIPLASQDVIGFFVNTLVLRADFSGGPSIRELLRRVRNVTLDAYTYRDVPFEKIVEELNPERDLSHNPLFQVMFSFDHENLYEYKSSDMLIKPVETVSGAGMFDLLLSLVHTNQIIVGSLGYNKQLFASATIARMVEHLQVILQQIVLSAEKQVAKIPLLTQKEQKLLIEWNATSTSYSQVQSIHDLFVELVERTPFATALLFEDQQVTYDELNKRANQLAHYLRSLGVEPEARVGIYMYSSIDMMIALLGILKAGGVYVPLDPTYPHERLAFMLADSRASVLLTEQRLSTNLPHTDTQTICLDVDWSLIALQETYNLSDKGSGTNLAYIIYTSGSTGRPKGVAMTHRALINLLNWQIDGLERTEGVRVLQFASLSFDASFQEIFSTWCSGGTLVLIPTELRRDFIGLLRFLSEYYIERLFLPFVALQYIAEVAEELSFVPASLREVIAGGEQLCITDSIRKFFIRLGKCHLQNFYGPTETHGVTAFTLSGPPQNWPTLPPIGRPIFNTQIYILDTDFQSVPIGIPGELYISGECLARGYFNCPDLTAQRFLPNPFSNKPGTRMYKTGDLARYLSDGNIEFLGRVDHQVKLRGHRIELGEIEVLLSQHPNVRAVAVIIQEIVSAGKQLVAYIVPQEKQHISPAELRRFLQNQLPDYMLPSSFVSLDELPLTPSGKIDRKTLSELTPASPDRQNSIAAPRTPDEVLLLKIWSQVLGREQIGIYDNFFDIGGHSLLAVRLQTQVQKHFSIQFPLSILFRAQTIEQMGLALRQRIEAPPSPIVIEIQPGHTKPPLFCIHPAGGNILCYQELARSLGEDQPLYGIQSPVLAHSPMREFPRTIEGMANLYIKEVFAVQQQGPYQLCGWSFGGSIAFEMARQLQIQGHLVSTLALIDSWAPIHQNKVAAYDDYQLLSMFFEDIFAQKEKYNIDMKRRISHNDQPHNILDFIKNIIAMPLDIEWQQLEYLFTTFKLNMYAWLDYNPPEYTRQLDLFQANEDPLRTIRDRSMGWGQLVTSHMQIHTLPGNHYTIIKYPHVVPLAERLKKLIIEGSF